ncbi:MAG: methionine--tRNA ligase [Candidatus Thermoplasmatota archaeon]|nr:methionine--tRNA ligase [Candidatus Thermoplasmatota archaeon]
MAKIFIGVAWPYANGSLHLGHVAGSLLAPDIFARYHRLIGNEVLMVSGSDEHGTPITLEAEKRNMTPKELVDYYHQEHLECLKKLGISFDYFSRTTKESHKKVVQEFFIKLFEKGYICSKKVGALYCQKCRRWLPDRYVEGICPYCNFETARGDQCEKCGRIYECEELLEPKCKLCGSSPERREAEHLFLKLSALKELLLKYLEDKKFWKENVYKFTLNWVKELKERAITRDIDWGIDVPLEGYRDKKLYVWFEAVIGYLSASKDWSLESGKSWEAFWKDKGAKHYYFVGKDNIPFHTVIWPAMLIAHNELVLPYNVPANEYLTLKGEHFSKSRGIAVWLPACLEKFDADAIRYYLIVNMPETKDLDFSWEDFITKNNTELVATLGNFIYRVLSFAHKNFNGIPKKGNELDDLDNEAIRMILNTYENVTRSLERCEFKNALREIMALAHYGNKYIDEKAPWKMIKEDRKKCQTAIYVSCRLVKALALLLEPFLPFSAQKLQAQLGFKSKKWGDCLEDISEHKLERVEMLFKKLDKNVAS